MAGHAKQHKKMDILMVLMHLALYVPISALLESKPQWYALSEMADRGLPCQAVQKGESSVAPYRGQLMLKLATMVACILKLQS
eukprot:1152079-Pelagomonas_calceolata.AAC.5